MSDKKATIAIETKFDGKQLQTAKKQVEEVAKATEKAQDAIDKNSQATSSFSLKAVAAWAAVAAAIKKAYDFAKESVQAYLANARAVNMLEASFKAVGYTSAQAMKQAKAFASEMQSLTGIADEAFLNAQRLLANYGVVGSKAQESIRAAYSLSIGVGMDFESALLQIAKAAAGSTSALSRYGIVLDDSLKPAEKFDAVLGQINDRFGAAAQAAMGDTITKVKALNQEWGDFKEMAGKELEPIFRRLIEYSREFVSGLSALFGRTDNQKKYQQNLEQIAKIQKEINDEDDRAIKYELENSKKLGDINWRIVNKQQEARYAKIEALKKENAEIEKQNEEELKAAKIENQRAKEQEKVIENKRLEKAHQEAITKAAKETAKAQEDNLKKQQKILDNLGVSSSKDLKGWGKGQAESGPMPSDLEIAAGGGNALSSAADSIARYDAESERLAALYEEKRLYIEQEITDEQLKQEALTNLQNQYEQQRLANDKNTAKARQQVYSAMWSALTGLASSSNKKVAAIGKVASVAQATMSMFTGAAKALELPFPANLAAVATVLAQGAALVEQIQAVKLAQGGLVKAVSGGVNTIIGEGGSDEAVLPLDNTRAMQRIGSAIGDAGGVGANVVVNINVAASGGVEAILEQLTEASRSGVVQALEFANLNYKVGQEQQGLSV